jgi:hypothetical protein
MGQRAKVRWGRRNAMWVWMTGALIGLMLGTTGCEPYGTEGILYSPPPPPPPLALSASYFAQGVDLTWALDPRWAHEPFRVYSRRKGESAYRLIAEISSCRAGACEYRDVRVDPGVTYQYYVAAVGVHTGIEASSATAVEVSVPFPAPPPIPGGLRAVALDGMVYLTWSANARTDPRFARYHVYLQGSEGEVVHLGSTDAEGFLDSRVENGKTYGYFIRAESTQGHQSQSTGLALATPRPDYRGEVLHAFPQDLYRSGFRFPDNEQDNPIRSGEDPLRDFRLEFDAEGWWLVPGPGVLVHERAHPTSALRCGPGADAGCVDLSQAPTTGYVHRDMGLSPGYSYVLRVPGNGGTWHVGVVRVSHVGFAQSGPIVIFDWAFQLQSGNLALSPRGGAPPPS